jgi:hypothetical protein
VFAETERHTRGHCQFYICKADTPLESGCTGVVRAVVGAEGVALPCHCW